MLGETEHQTFYEVRIANSRSRAIHGYGKLEIRNEWSSFSGSKPYDAGVCLGRHAQMMPGGCEIRLAAAPGRRGLIRQTPASGPGTLASRCSPSSTVRR